MTFGALKSASSKKMYNIPTSILKKKYAWGAFVGQWVWDWYWFKLETLYQWLGNAERDTLECDHLNSANGTGR